MWVLGVSCVVKRDPKPITIIIIIIIIIRIILKLILRHSDQ